MEGKKTKKQPEPEKVNIECSLDEIRDMVSDLEEDEDIKLFLKVQKGASKYNRLVDYVEVLTKAEKK